MAEIKTMLYFTAPTPFPQNKVS